MRFRGAFAPLMVVLGLTALGAGTPAYAAAPATGSVTIVAAPTDSGSVVSGQDLTVQVGMNNNSSSNLDAGTAVLSVGTSPFASRSDLTNWLDGSTKTALATQQLTSVPTPGVAFGSTDSLAIVAPAATLTLGSAGVYPINVALRSGTSTVAMSRSAISWNGSSTKPVPLAIAVPITVPASNANTDFLTAKLLQTYTAPTGVLTRELEQVTGTDVAIGIDPRIIASIRVLGKLAPQSSLDWLAALAALPNDTFPLQWADADVTVALQAGLPTVLLPESLQYAIDPTRFGPSNSTPAGGTTNSPTPTPTPTTGSTIPPLPTSQSLTEWNYTLPAAAWPADNSVTNADLPKLLASGIKTLVLTSKNVDAGTSSAVTLDGVTGLVSDSGLSDYLRAAVQSTTRPEWLAATAALASTIDQISLASPSEPPRTLISLGRNWAQSPVDLQRTLNDLYSQPWIAPSTLSAVNKSQTTTATLDDNAESSFRVARVRSMLQVEQQTAAFSSIVDDAAALNSSRRLILLSDLSNELSPGSAAWDKATSRFNTDSLAIVNSVQIVSSSPINMIANQGSLPVTISNDFSQAVTVYVQAAPQTAQLFVQKKGTPVKVTVAAGEQKRALIPVKSVSNGKVRLKVTLVSSTGVQVGETKYIPVNVQAGWETAGTIIFAGLVLVIFGAGIVRSVLKRRKARAE